MTVRWEGQRMNEEAVEDKARQDGQDKARQSKQAGCNSSRQLGSWQVVGR